MMTSKRILLQKRDCHLDGLSIEINRAHSRVNKRNEYIEYAYLVHEAKKTTKAIHDARKRRR